jgi:membrane fusion protein, multidrug efflux system
MTKPASRHFGRLAIAVCVVAVVGIAAYGIWSRHASVERLQQVADDASLPRVEAISPKPGPDEQSLTLPGEIAAWNEAQIYGQVSGYVSHWYKDYGARVKAGDVLATIDTPGLDAQFEASKASLAVAQAKSNLADLTAKRFDALTGTAAVTQQDIDDKNATAAEQKAEVAAAQQNVDHYQAMIGFKKLVVPFDGIVTARRVNIGDFINAAGGDATQRSSAQALFSVGDIHKLRVFVSVPQDFASILKPDLKAVLHPLNNPGQSIPAQFLTMAGAVDRSTRTVVTEFVIDNPQEDLWPGAYVDVDLKFPSDPNILIVPSQALLFRAQDMQVALLDGEDRVHLQGVTLGRNLGLNVQIVAGLKATDRIVANPSLGLLDGQQVKVVQATQGYQPAGGHALSTAE